MFHFSYFLATEVILLAYGMDCNNTVPPKRSNIDGCYYLHLHYLLLHPLHLFFSKITLTGNLSLEFSFQATYASLIFTFFLQLSKPPSPNANNACPSLVFASPLALWDAQKVQETKKQKFYARVNTLLVVPMAQKVMVNNQITS